jgi:hypothetical protein
MGVVIVNQMLMIKRIVAAIFFFLIFAKGIYGQEACNQVLIKAQISYYEGRADEVPDILEDCLKNGFTTDEKLQAYRLLTLTYLYLNEPANAEISLLNLLKWNPEYKVDEALDPTEFINLFRLFRTLPIYMVGVKTGANVSYVQTFRHYSLDNSLAANFSYQPQVSYQAGAYVELPFRKHFSFTAGFYVTGKKFVYKNNQFDYSQLTSNESQHHMGLPITLNYHLFGGQKRRLQPFLTAGICTDVLLNVSSQVRRDDIIQNRESKKEVTGPNVTLSAQRRVLTYSAMMGAGFKLKSGRNYFLLEANYKVGMSNIVKPHERYSNTDLIFRYGYLDNDFRINSMWLSVGYTIPVYQPKVKK